MEEVKLKRGFTFQKGQALLVALLIMTVGLTVALAVIARSVTSIKISTQEESSQKAFEAAEAGLETFLLNPSQVTPYSLSLPGGANFTVISTSQGGNFFPFPDIVNQDETQTLWLVAHNSDTTLCAPSGCTSPPSGVTGDGRYISPSLDICWTGVGGTPAMEIIIIYQNLGGSQSYGLARGAYDPDPGSRPGPPNNFDMPETAGGYCGGGFQYRQTIEFSSFFATANRRVVALRLRPIYNDSQIAAQGSTNLPPQGDAVESTGTAGSPTNVRKLTVTRAYPSWPPIFDYVLFSGQNLVK